MSCRSCLEDDQRYIYTVLVFNSRFHATVLVPLEVPADFKDQESDLDLAFGTKKKRKKKKTLIFENAQHLH